MTLYNKARREIKEILRKHGSSFVLKTTSTATTPGSKPWKSDGTDVTKTTIRGRLERQATKDVPDTQAQNEKATFITDHTETLPRGALLDQQSKTWTVHDSKSHEVEGKVVYQEAELTG